MIQSQDLALSGFPEVIEARFYFPPKAPRRGFLGFQVICGLVIIMMAFISWPRHSSAELNLTSDNLLYLTNLDRIRQGLKPLKTDPKLTRAAVAKAEHMLKRAYFAHVSPDGKQAWDFIKAQNFNYTFAGENLAMNYTSSFELEHDFLQSPAHRENLLSALYSETGIAVVSGYYKNQPAILIVEIFASPAPGSQNPVAINSNLER